MSIRFKCQHCNTSMAASDRLAGAKVKCKKCGETVVVPSVSATRVAAKSEEKHHGPTAFSAALLEDDDAAEPPFEFRRRRDVPDEENDVDMTPMVDVTFLLLIFFMVTAAFTIEAAFPSPASEKEDSASVAKPIDELLDDADYVIVYVNSDNTYRISASFWDEEKDAPSDQEMRVKMRQARRGPGGGAKRPNKLLIMASATARNDKVIKVYDEGNDLEMENIRIEMVDEDEF
jgi:biopolymer transport protein ExbD